MIDTKVANHTDLHNSIGLNLKDIHISIFNNLRKPNETPRITTIENVVSSIKSGDVKYLTDRIQNGESELKNQLPCIIFSGEFSVRKTEGLINHSGFMCVDFDKYPTPEALQEHLEELKQNPHFVLLFISPSGNGIKGVVRIPIATKETHTEYFKGFNQKFKYKYFDEATSDVARVCFMSYDPNIYVNWNATIFDKKTIKETKTATPINVTVPLTDEFQIIERIMKFPWKKDFREGERNAYIFNISSAMCERGVSQETAQGYILNNVVYGDFSEQEAIKTITSAYKKRVFNSKPFQDNSKKVIQKPDGTKEVTEKAKKRDAKELITDIKTHLNANYEFKINEITQHVEMRTKGANTTFKVLEEFDLNDLILKCMYSLNSKEVTQSIMKQILYSSATPTYNPITEFINKYKDIPTTGELENLCLTINSNTKLKNTFIKKWMLSIIGAYRGYPVRSVLALTGGQNTGKTEWFRNLLPKELLRYYGESKLDAGKDDELLMCQKLILLDDEMGGKSKQDEKHFKMLSSKNIFSLRPPFGAMNRDFKRLAVLCGTSNDHEIVNDPTGNTRILPIHVISINHDLYNSIDKNALFIELWNMYSQFMIENPDVREDKLFSLTNDEIKILAEISNDFKGISIEGELVRLHLTPITEETKGVAGWYTATEVKEYLEKRSSQKIWSIKKLCFELTDHLGASVLTRNKNGVQARRYCMLEKIDDPNIWSNNTLIKLGIV